ncbi:hypothetical protein [Aquimarina macrocephali]|uniref:hypothetical protein n=1 Tax=Aquimarina macrocephali TaxID=666563 RepID=UPI003F66F42C
MTEAEVKNIAIEVFENLGVTISSLVKFKPAMKTKEVCAYLNCDRKWLYRNKEMFGARIINRKNHYEFDTEKVVNYKLKFNL